MTGYSRSFPRDRIQRLFDRRKYTGISPKIETEGVFMQIGDDGRPWRQVLLGVTRMEFVVVKQELRSMPVEGPYELPIDLCDLDIEHVVPLALLRFFVLDDRSRRFIVCTCLDHIYYFEMCQLELDTDCLWRKWRSFLVKHGGVHEGRPTSGFTEWRSPYVVNIKHNQYDRFEIARNIFGRPKCVLRSYVYRPLPFAQVISRGVQTDDTYTDDVTAMVNASVSSIDMNASAGLNARVEDIAKSNNVKFYTLKLRAENEAEKLIDRLLSYAPNNNPRVMMIRPALYKRSIVLTTSRYSCERREVTLSGQLKSNPEPRRSRSWSSIEASIVNGACSGGDSNSDDVHERECFALKTLKQKRTQNERDSQVSAMIRFLDSELTKNSATGSRYGIRWRLSGFELWQRTRSQVLNRGISVHQRRLEEIASYAVFNASEYREPPSCERLLRYHPLDVSMTLASLSRRLWLSVTVQDLHLCIVSGEKELPPIAVYEKEVNKLVVLELLRNYHLDHVAVLNFFVQICTDLLFKHRDLQTLTAVLKGLTSLPVYRLNIMWATFALREPLTFRRFLAMLPLISENPRYSGYCRRVSRFLATDVPYIPLFEHLLAHCITRKVATDEAFHVSRVRHFSKRRHSTFMQRVKGPRWRAEDHKGSQLSLKGSGSGTKKGKKKKKTEDNDTEEGKADKSVFKALRNKMKNERDIVTEHINVVQQDIADIEAIIDGVKIYEEDTEVEETEKTELTEEEKEAKRLARKRAKERRKAKEEEDKRMETVMNSIYGTLEKEELDELIKDNQVPFRPNFTKSNQHMSIMQHALEDRESQVDENEEFDEIKRAHELRTRHSTLGILGEDSDESLDHASNLGVGKHKQNKGRQPSTMSDFFARSHISILERQSSNLFASKRTKSSLNSGRLDLTSESHIGSHIGRRNTRSTVSVTAERSGSTISNVVKSVTHFFEDKFHSNHNNSSLEDHMATYYTPNQYIIDRTEGRPLDFRQCYLCADRMCIYCGKSYYKQLLEEQEMIKQVHVQAKPNVVDYLKNALNNNRSITDFDLMELSQSCE